MTAPRELLSYLDSIQKRYPYGVPREMIRSEKQGGLKEEKAKVAVLFVGKVSPVEGELLNAAITKGIKVDLSAVKILAEEITESVVTEFIIREHPQCVVFLGNQEWLTASVGASKMGVIAGVPTLVSYEMSEIVKEASIKRAFWEDLKKVVNLLQTNSWA